MDMSQRASSSARKPKGIITSTLFDKMDNDKNRSLSREELLSYASQALGLPREQCKARIDDLFSMFDLDESDSVELNEFYAIILSAMPLATECELKRTIKPKYLIEWAEKSAVIKPISIALFFELDDSLRSSISDDAPLSAYRDNSRATFFRTLVHAFPFLIDWLCSANQDQILFLRSILNSLNECRDALGSSGSFAKMIVEIDRAPVVSWLLEASPERRALFRAVFKAIADSNADKGRDLRLWGDMKDDIESNAVAMTMPVLPKKKKTWNSASSRDSLEVMGPISPRSTEKALSGNNTSERSDVQSPPLGVRVVDADERTPAGGSQRSSPVPFSQVAANSLPPPPPLDVRHPPPHQDNGSESSSIAKT